MREGEDFEFKASDFKGCLTNPMIARRANDILYEYLDKCQTVKSMEMKDNGKKTGVLAWFNDEALKKDPERRIF